MARSITDGKTPPATTVYDYSDAPSGAPSGVATGCSSGPSGSHAFVSQIANALGQKTDLQWDCNIGKATTIFDVDQVATSAVYNDAFERLTSVNAANLVQTTYGYPNLTTEVTHHDVNSFGDGMNVSEVLYDGLGRQFENRQYVDTDTCSSGGFVSVQKQYDALGRVWTVSNPFCATGSSDSPPASSLTTTAYDALGRVLLVTSPDGAQTQTSYVGNVATIQDAANNKRGLTTDAFGRTTQAVEYGKGATLSYTTLYTYNALNNLTCVNQSGQYRVFGYDSMSRLILADNPETRVQAISSCTAGSPTITFAYDNANNLISETDTGGFTITYVPDALNRVSSKTSNDGTTQYTFDQNLAIPGETDTNYPAGRLSSVSFGTVTQTYRYDALGRYQSSEQTVAGQANSPFVFHYNHVPAGLATEKYPSQRTIATTYDAAGRPNGVTGYASGITYAPHGAVSGMTLGSGVQESWSFNSRLQPTCLTAGVPQAAPLLQLTNAYTTATPGTGGACALSGTDNNGNVVSQTTTAGSANFNLSYSYADGSNRITSATETNQETIQNQASPGLGWAQQFSYNDAWGNRTLGSTSISSGWSYPPAFDAGNHVTGTGWSYSGDHRGNLASTPEMAAMTYDAESRLQTAVGPYGTSQFVYDGDGRRVMATQGGTETVYVYDAMGQLAAEYGGTATGSGRGYLTADHLGSTRLVTGTGGTVVERHDYAPFGEEIAAQGCGQPVGSAGRSSRCDIPGYGAASEVPLLFTGKERDGNTGLDYFGARYFSSAQGRFTSVDPELIPRDITNPQIWNKYAYALNNPLRFVDPDGAAVIDAGLVQIGTASFRVYQPQQGATFDRAALLSTVWMGQIGSNQSSINRNLEELKQKQSSWWFPAQQNGEGSCVLGCVSTFNEQAVGITLSVAFNYDKNDQLTGATVAPGIDQNARFMSSSPPPTVTMGIPLAGMTPPAQTLRVDINPAALKNLSPQQLQALAKAAVNVSIEDVRNALSGAISQEQERRAAEQRKHCQSGQSGCTGN